jgi:hypothetical protein
VYCVQNSFWLMSSCPFITPSDSGCLQWRSKEDRFLQCIHLLWHFLIINVSYPPHELGLNMLVREWNSLSFQCIIRCKMFIWVFNIPIHHACTVSLLTAFPLKAFCICPPPLILNTVIHFKHSDSLCELYQTLHVCSLSWKLRMLRSLGSYPPISLWHILVSVDSLDPTRMTSHKSIILIFLPLVLNLII